MPPTDELKQLAKKFSDKARKTTRLGKTALIPHKFKETGEIVSNENFDISVDLSKLSLTDLRFLDAWKDAGWDMDKACAALGIEPAKAKRSYEKVKYFEYEDKKVKSLAKVPTPEFVAAKNLEGFYQDNLSDGQRDHLKELAKITGAYKPTTNLHITANAFVMPQLAPEQAEAAKKFFDTIAEDTRAA